VGIIGFGQMGCGIAEVCARAELDVLVCEANEAAAVRGSDRLQASLLRAQNKGLITSAEDVAARVRITDDLAHLHDREIVIDAIPEIEQAKLDLFVQLDKIVTSPDAVLATNTSSIPIARLAAATGRPNRVIGVHFFNPAPVMSLVELVPSLSTDASVVEAMRGFVEGNLGKHAIVATDRSGFVVNALLVPYLLSAIRMVEGGYASAEDIDQGMMRGCAHPQGPLALCDLIGLDVVKGVADSMYAEYKEPLYAAPPLLNRMVEAGRLGRKSGQGFYPY
jgi:3-hydroxybutyryl-CoA dehydrogenase